VVTFFALLDGGVVDKRGGALLVWRRIFFLPAPPHLFCQALGCIDGVEVRR